MALAAGTRFGPYEILAQIGVGGMGEVYRARDTKLEHEVAMKVLSAELAEDPEWLARFKREAKVLASLNHANIAQIYGIEEPALVMELVPGATIKGPLQLGTVLEYARQIADALEAAHEKSIIHRDLKPDNIMITPAGVVKVLDFGLAAVAPSTYSSNPEHSPTLTISPTRAGTILGTAAYMSPEQAQGKAVDNRADIWAFGVVLYEMLTGKRLFEGETVSDTLAQVLTKEPDWEQVPARVKRLLDACLQKERKRRLQAIGDWRLLLAEARPQATVASRSRLGWAVAALLAIAAAVGLTGWYRAARPAEPMPLVRFDADLGSDVALDSVRGADAILSPDGTRLVYVSQRKLFTRKLDQPKAAGLAGTEGAYAPFFSPDGRWVAFFAEDKLKKLSVDGGAPVILCDATIGFGGSWGEDGNIIASLTAFGTLSRIPSAGGPPTTLSKLAPGDYVEGWPQILPGGKAVLFTSTTARHNGAIEVMSLQEDRPGKARRRKTLVRGGTFGRYLAISKGAGYVVYVSNGALFAVAFDPEALEVHGTPLPVLGHVAYDAGDGFAQFDFSQTGMLLYRSDEVGGGLDTVQWLDSTGKTQPLLAKPGIYERPLLSPDGQRLALITWDGSNSDIWIYDWRRDNMTRLTFDAGAGGSPTPVWSPDGRYITFAGNGGIFWIRSDGAGKPHRLTQTENGQYPWSFTPDGKRLAWEEWTNQRGSAKSDLWTMPLESAATGLEGGKPELFLQTSFSEANPTFSPDGRWLAYTSNESGTYQVYVRAFPDTGGKWQISNNGGTYPSWSHNERKMFFRSADNQVMVSSYTVKGDSFVADQPRVWSEKRLADAGTIGVATYDVAPDGKRVAALMPVDTPEARRSQNHVILLMNFFDELRRSVPLKGK